jgi:hypothetical protein
LAKSTLSGVTANDLSASTGSAHDLLDRRSLVGERANGSAGLFTAKD